MSADSLLDLPPYRLTFGSARTGDRVPVIETGGRTYWLASRYDPARDVEQFSAQLSPDAGDLLILAGGGPAVLRAVLARPGAFWIAYVEPIPELRDDAYPADPRLVVHRTTDELFEWLNSLGVETLRRYQLVVYPPLKAPFGDYLKGLAAATQAAFDKRISSIQTLLAVGELAVSNLIVNLPAFSRMAPVRRLFSAAPGSVACVAASGPGLDDAVPEFQRLRDRICLVAVDSAVLPLIDRGLVPDAAVCLDPREDLVDHIEPIGASDRKRLVWVVSAAIHPAVNRLLEGCRRFVFAGDHPMETWFSSRAGDPGILAGGGSVILPAFDLARRLGAATIVLAGADFSMGKDLRMHASGTGRMQKTVSTQNRFEPLETSMFQDAESRAPKHIKVEGGIIRSGENLLAYRHQLDSLIATFEGRCLQFAPRLQLERATPCRNLRDLGDLPIRKDRSLCTETDEAWMTESIVRALQAELRARWSAKDPGRDGLFRTAIEARVFRRIRAGPEPVGKIWLEETDRMRSEWIRLADQSWEAR